jgi:hypothetical protein
MMKLETPLMRGFLLCVLSGFVGKEQMNIELRMGEPAIAENLYSIGV